MKDRQTERHRERESVRMTKLYSPYVGTTAMHNKYTLNPIQWQQGKKAPYISPIAVIKFSAAKKKLTIGRDLYFPIPRRTREGGVVPHTHKDA